MHAKRDRWLNGKSTRMGSKWVLFGSMALTAAAAAGWLALYLQVSRGLKARVEGNPGDRSTFRLTIENRGPLSVTVKRFHLTFVETGVETGTTTITPGEAGLDLTKGASVSLVVKLPDSLSRGRQTTDPTPSAPRSVDVLGVASYGTLLTRGETSFSGSLQVP